MKKLLCMLLCLCLCAGFAAACGEEETGPEDLYSAMLTDLAAACDDPSGEALARAEESAALINDGVAPVIAENWRKIWLDPEYRLYVYGADDPAALPVSGRHAFVVLGFELENGEMTEELIGRCDAAAEAARAFPESFVVCSGGATGENNPDGHTEAGLMKAYLSENCGIAPERILTDESAMTTMENAKNTFEILMANGVESMTVITSDYHQRRGSTLYGAMAARYERAFGYTVELIGNFCYPAEADENRAQFERMVASWQLNEIVHLPLGGE